jgi:hypothetical protein
MGLPQCFIQGERLLRDQRGREYHARQSAGNHRHAVPR